MKRNKLFFLIFVVAWFSQILTAQTVVSDDSDGPFSILAQMVNVNSPNGGENWNGGETHDVIWSMVSSTTFVNIDYSIDSGSSWTSLAIDTINDGIYAWDVPLISSSTCLVRVSDAANAATFDTSNAMFTITTLETISEPNRPTGTSTGGKSTSYPFTTGGSISNLDHAVQYKFDWGDGTASDWLDEGTASAAHAWAATGTYQVKAMARCAEHTSIESSWSETYNITITDSGPTEYYNLHEFAGNDMDGSYPWGSLIISGSILYGMTSEGGNNGKGTIFKIGIDGTGFSLLHEFGNVANGGANPQGDLIISGSTLYGMTAEGGDSDFGTIFKIETDGTGFTLLHKFIGGVADGRQPYGSLILFGTTLYGATAYGCIDYNLYGGYGTIFKIETDGTGYTLLHKFASGENDGGMPFESPILVGSTLYGTTAYGGDNNSGTLYKINTDGSGYALFHEFAGSPDDGGFTHASLVLSGSTFYGMTNRGGENDYGTIYKIQTDGSGYALLHEFTGDSADGGYPFESLILSGSTLYGMTYLNYGKIFKIQTDGNNFSLLHIFSGGADDGGNPYGSLILSGAVLYGMTYSGGDNDRGVIFSLPLPIDNIIVTSPNGGEKWISGTVQNITWNSPDTITNVNIDYSTDNGSSWTSVAPNIANSGTYAWTVPATLSTTCLVRVSDAVNAGTYDVSDAVFSISTVSTLTISGTIALGGTGLANVVMNGLPGNPTTNSSGFYTAAVGYNWSGTVTPTLAGYTFSPANRTYTNVVADQLTQDYSAAIITFIVSGTITSGSTGLANVVMNGLPGNPTTNASGFYSAMVNYNWSGTATPTLASYTFSPVNRTYTNVIANQLTQDYSAVLITFTISGTITTGGTGLGNVVMDGLPGNPTTNASGFYSAVVNYNWSGTVTPTLAGCTFTPAYTIYTNVMANQTTNYTATVTPSIVVTSPNGGEQWQRGIAQTITWTSVGVTNVKILLIKGTAVNTNITNSTSAAGGSYPWTIPASQTTGTDYKIRIVSKESSAVQDSSNANFTIFAPSITITAPATGASWQRGVMHTITWNKEGILDANVMIQLIKGTAVNSTIAATTPNDGSFDWTIPAGQALAANYKIRIKTIDNLITANSGKFSITNTPGLTLQSPNGKERIVALSTFPISWTVDPSMNEVKLEYSRDNGGTFFIIADHVPNTGQYAWRVPVNFTFNGIVRVNDSRGKNWLDEEGVLECLFKFNCSSRQEARQPDFAVWFGMAKIKSPGYGFANVAIGRDMVRMAEISQTIEPLSSDWHEAKIRLDLKRDLGTLFIDNQRLLENVALCTSLGHHFEPYLSIRTEGSTAVDLLLAELTVQVTLLSAEGNEKDRFTILSEDFGGYDDERNVIGNSWQASGLKTDGPALNFKALPGMGQALRLQSAAGAPVTIGKSLAVPETIPFDISDRSFIIEMWQGVD